MCFRQAGLFDYRRFVRISYNQKTGPFSKGRYRHIFFVFLSEKSLAFSALFSVRLLKPDFLSGLVSGYGEIHLRPLSAQSLKITADSVSNRMAALHAYACKKNQVLICAVPGIDVASSQHMSDSLFQKLRTGLLLFLVLNNFPLIIYQCTQHQAHGLSASLTPSGHKSVDIYETWIRAVIGILPICAVSLT